MPAQALNDAQRLELREMASALALQGASYREISAKWNENYPEAEISRATVAYHLAKLREQALSRIAENVDALTQALVASLAGQALIQSKNLFEWDESGNVKIKASADLTAAEMSCLTIRIRTDADGTKYSETTWDPSVRNMAADKLLRFMHGTKVNVVDVPGLTSRLLLAGDREGLSLMSEMETNKLDPTRILQMRSRHLAIFDLLSASADSEGVERLRAGENAVAVFKERAPFLALPEEVEKKEEGDE